MPTIKLEYSAEQAARITRAVEKNTGHKPGTLPEERVMQIFEKYLRDTAMRFVKSNERARITQQAPGSLKDPLDLEMEAEGW